MGIKRKFLFLLIILIAVGFISGSLFAAGQVEGESEDVVTIRLWQNLDNPEAPYFYNLIDKFNAEHPNIKVDFELVPWGGALDLYTTGLVVGDAADIIWHGTTLWGTQFWEMGFLEPLDDYIAKWDKADQIQEAAWSTSRASENEPIFGIPVKSTPGVIYYRKDWFKQLGIEVPNTREEFLAAAQKITDNIPGAYGFGMRGARGGAGQFWSFILPVVDNKWFDENGLSNFRKPEAIAAAEWFLDLYRVHKVTPPTAPSDGFAEIIEGFDSGLTGMIIHHIGSANTHVDALGEDKVGITYIPEIDGIRSAEGGCSHYVINAASSPKHKEAAFKFISWMGEAEQATYLGHYVGGIPVVKNAGEADPYFKDNVYARVSTESTAFAYGPPYLDTLGELSEQVWPSRTQQALLGKITAEELMNYLVEVIERGN